MKFFSTPTIGLGGLALAASLALFSSGASAIPVCVVMSNQCGGDLDPNADALFPGSAGWDFDFDADGFFTVPVGQLSLTFNIFTFGPEFDVSGAILTDINGDPIMTGLSAPVEAFTFVPGDDSQHFVASWAVSSAIQIYDFHLTCTDVDSGACDEAFAVSYNFVLTPDDEGPTVPAPAVAPLLLLGLAVTGLGALLRRRRPALEAAAAC